MIHLALIEELQRFSLILTYANKFLSKNNLSEEITFYPNLCALLSKLYIVENSDWQ